MKICIIGYSGSGKSTLAVQLGQKCGLPVLHLDATFWYGDWQQRSAEEQAFIVRKFMDDNPDGWVIDGNYKKICPERFEECDKLIFLNYNRFFCYKEAKKRYKTNRGNVRPDCPCIEKFDFEFKKWILFEGRTRKIKAGYKDLINRCKGEVFIFKSRKQLLKNIP